MGTGIGYNSVSTRTLAEFPDDSFQGELDAARGSLLTGAGSVMVRALDVQARSGGRTRPSR